MAFGFIVFNIKIVWYSCLCIVAWTVVAAMKTPVSRHTSNLIITVIVLLRYKQALVASEIT